MMNQFTRKFYLLLFEGLLGQPKGKGMGEGNEQLLLLCMSKKLVQRIFLPV
jgi:hypothetical protein